MQRKSKQSQINELERTLSLEQEYISKLKTELEHVNGRLKLIAAENESLIQDKKWLQSMHSNLLQTMFANRGSR